MDQFIWKLMRNKFLLALALLISNLSTLCAKYIITADDLASIDSKNTNIELHKNVIIKNKDNIFYADYANIKYINFNNIANNLKQKSFINFTKISAKGNVKIILKNSYAIADEFIYDIPKKIMLLRSFNKNTIYKNENITLTAKKQIEYQEEDNILVARGKPKLISQNKNNINQNYTIYADLMTAQLNSEKNNIEYAQAFDKVKFIHQNTIAKGNYALFDAKSNTILLKDNVKLQNKDSTILACELTINIDTGATDIIPCKDDTINTKIDLTSKNSN